MRGDERGGGVEDRLAHRVAMRREPERPRRRWSGARLQRVEWSDAEGVIEFTEGRCARRARPSS
ncbi:MAG TPA: hypothetical protein VFV01_12035 [Spirillospora sp.]|nr:hypothetical protein [Spirillospora sp.]